MTKQEKVKAIEDLTAQLAENQNIYLTDVSDLDALTTSNLRRACFKAGVKLTVVKNTLLAKAMEASDKDFGELPTVLKGNTSMMTAEAANAPAKLIKEFRKKSIISDSVLEDMIIVESESRKWMDQLREIKTEEEMILMRKAISITCDAQNELMKVLKPDMKEYQAEAVVEAVFKMNGAEYPGYPSIVGAAENSCILHYTTNRKTM